MFRLRMSGRYDKVLLHNNEGDKKMNTYFTNTTVNGKVVAQNTHWTLEQANEYADKVNASGGTCAVYVANREREATVYPPF